MDSLATQPAVDLRHFKDERPPGAMPAAPVFLSADGRRARLLRLGGCAAAALSALWLAALLSGTLGLGRLPGVPLPDIGGKSHRGSQSAAAEPTTRSARRRAPGASPERARKRRKRSAEAGGDQRVADAPASPRRAERDRRSLTSHRAPSSPGTGALRQAGSPAATAPPASSRASTPSVTPAPGRSDATPGAMRRPSEGRATGSPARPAPSGELRRDPATRQEPTRGFSRAR